MVVRLIGTDTADPWLPDIVKVHAAKTRIADAGNHYTSNDVEGALAELANAGVGGTGTGIVISPTPPPVTNVLWADTATAGVEAGSTVNVFVYADPIDERPNADVVFWIPDPFDLPDPFGALPGDCVLRSTPNVITAANGITTMWQGSAAEYDAITIPDPDTVYLILTPPLP
jgi:hypothetical protein